MVLLLLSEWRVASSRISCFPWRVSYLSKWQFVVPLSRIWQTFAETLKCHELSSSGKWPTWRTILFSYTFISILYMFRPTSCSSPRKSIVSIQRLVYVTLCGWPSGMQVRQDLTCIQGGPPTQSDIYQTLYWYNWFSWWWTRGCSKHVEDWNKTYKKKELCVKLVIYQNCTDMHGQQNIDLSSIKPKKRTDSRHGTVIFHHSNMFKNYCTVLREF
jgi:hypothetical protein